jgi:hypothetical protein
VAQSLPLSAETNPPIIIYLVYEFPASQAACTSLNLMNPEIRSALDELLQSTAHWKDSTKGLVCFYPMRGSCADGRLMLVGRALYGWGTTVFKAPQMESEDERSKIVENTIEFSSPVGQCPIQRLHDSWLDSLRNKKSKYNPERSSFWCVGREVIKEFSSPEEKELWLNYLYWTNLYKVSFQSTGNPSGSLQKVMRQGSCNMLAAEIESFQPQRILFLTGQWWAEPFLSNSSFIHRGTATDSHVHQTGFWSLNNGCKAAVVVADHPERKKRDEIVSEIMDAFKRLGEV